MWDPRITEPEESEHRKRAESGRESNPNKKKKGGRIVQIKQPPMKNLIRREFKQITKSKGTMVRTSKLKSAPKLQLQAATIEEKSKGAAV
jgi:hypothetical protein